MIEIFSIEQYHQRRGIGGSDSGQSRLDLLDTSVRIFNLLLISLISTHFMSLLYIFNSSIYIFCFDCCINCFCIYNCFTFGSNNYYKCFWKRLGMPLRPWCRLLSPFWIKCLKMDNNNLNNNNNSNDVDFDYNQTLHEIFGALHTIHFAHFYDIEVDEAIVEINASNNRLLEKIRSDQGIQGIGIDIETEDEIKTNNNNNQSYKNPKPSKHLKIESVDISNLNLK